MKRFARFFQLFYNSGNFHDTREVLFSGKEGAFMSFLKLSDFIWEKTGRTHQFQLAGLFRLLFEFLTTRNFMGRKDCAELLQAEFKSKPGRKDHLNLLK